MNQVETEQFVRDDRNDLLALLEMRFGGVPQPVQEQICRLQDLNELQRLIIAACNAVDWEVFMEELQLGQDSFKLTGERFNPVNQQGKGHLCNG
ncbi:hypothetical protein [Paenibacillus sp. FSL L8-0689]|uniref:hypothetical protein n=1 Tax=Paenibacillus sp. FSL L8-0689 TaxID=2921607 RepID=UPI0030FC19F1